MRRQSPGARACVSSPSCFCCRIKRAHFRTPRKSLLHSVGCPPILQTRSRRTRVRVRDDGLGAPLPRVGHRAEGDGGGRGGPPTGVSAHAPRRRPGDVLGWEVLGRGGGDRRERGAGRRVSRAARPTPLAGTASRRAHALPRRARPPRPARGQRRRDASRDAQAAGGRRTVLEAKPHPPASRGRVQRAIAGARHAGQSLRAATHGRREHGSPRDDARGAARLPSGAPRVVAPRGVHLSRGCGAPDASAGAPRRDHGGEGVARDPRAGTREYRRHRQVPRRLRLRQARARGAHTSRRR